jgi:NADH-quinone oxidoreductase subunit G
MVNIEINGTPIQARDGAMIIEAADAAGIVIPRFCYHKKLSIAANCRMCLVEVEKARKPVPACATPVSEGMKVFTRSPAALESQKSVMEFLLINHPLDCPICDQGGECPLQETAMGYGKDVSRFSEGKRVVKDKDLGPLVATDMTRCIHCTRCVRFGVEIGGIKELGATGRGEHMEIGTYVAHALESEVAGNVIDLCPVGALTSKPYRYTARPWELQASPSVSPHDCVGTDLTVHTRRGKVMRVVPRENEPVNECWIADRDRYSYLGCNSEARLTGPRIKDGGQWRDADWEEALGAAVEGLKAAGAELGALASPSATVEELYALQKLVRGRGSPHIDHRLRQSDFADQAKDPVFPYLGLAISELESLDAALLVGSHLRKEQPLLDVRLRKMALAGGRACFVNPVDYAFNLPVHRQLVSGPAHLVQDLAGIAKALKDLAGQRAPAGMAQLWGEMEPGEDHQAIARALHEGEKKAVLLGALAVGHPQYTAVRALAGIIAKWSGSAMGYLPGGGNGAGAWQVGAVPHRLPGGKPAEGEGMDWRGMLEAGLKAYLLLGVEPELDSADPALATRALAKSFVVALTPFANPRMEGYADVILPVGPFTETAGTLVNVEGRWQSFRGVATPVGESRPAWKVLRVLGTSLEVAGCEWFSADQIRDEAREAVGEVKADNALTWTCPESLVLSDGVQRVGEVPIYAVDAVVRHSAALQETPDGRRGAAVSLNPATAERLGLAGAEQVTVTQGEGSATLPLVIDERVADHSAHIPAGLPETADLGAAFGPVDIAAASGAAVGQAASS